MMYVERSRGAGRRRVARLAATLSVCLGAAALTVALPAGAEPNAASREEAKALFAEGKRLRAEGKVADALDRLGRAHDLAPTPVTRLELAKALLDAGRLVEAHERLASIPSMPITSTETQKSKAARDEGAALASSVAGRLPRVLVRVVPDRPDTTIAVDGAVWPAERLGVEVPLDPGDHVLTARRGETVAERPFKLLERDRPTLEIGVADPPPPPPPVVVPEVKPVERPAAAPPPRREAPAAPEASISPLVPVAFTVGGVALATGIVTGAIALSQVGDLEAQCPGGVCGPDAGLATHRALTTTSTVAFIVGGAATVLGAVVWIADAATPDAPPPAFVRLETNGTSVALRGVW